MLQGLCRTSRSVLLGTEKILLGGQGWQDHLVSPWDPNLRIETRGQGLPGTRVTSAARVEVLAHIARLPPGGANPWYTPTPSTVALNLRTHQHASILPCLFHGSHRNRVAPAAINVLSEVPEFAVILSYCAPRRGYHGRGVASRRLQSPPAQARPRC